MVLPAEAFSNQHIGWCCTDRLSRHRLPGPIRSKHVIVTMMATQDLNHAEKQKKRVLISALLVTIVCVIAVWFALLFTGVVDSGQFDLLQSLVISPNHIAMLARRSDHVALSGNSYFVLIGTHPYSAKELRYAFHSSKPVFISGRDLIVLDKTDSGGLVIKCVDCGITKDLIEKQRFQDNGINVEYVGFP
jgi:hypothetical protein